MKSSGVEPNYKEIKLSRQRQPPLPPALTSAKAKVKTVTYGCPWEQDRTGSKAATQVGPSWLPVGWQPPVAQPSKQQPAWKAVSSSACALVDAKFASTKFRLRVPKCHHSRAHADSSLRVFN